jgi:hypothetical protein
MKTDFLKLIYMQLKIIYLIKKQQTNCVSSVTSVGHEI